MNPTQTLAPAAIPEDLQPAIDALATSPLHALSLSSRELFYSNLIAWAVERFPNQMQSALEPWLEACNAKEAVRVRREWKHLDLLIELPGRRPLVIENKSLATPDEQQLSRYDLVLEDAVSHGEIETPTRVLLSAVPPGWPQQVFASGTGAIWRWVSYREFGRAISEAFLDVPTSYEAETVRHLAALLERLEGVLTSDLARPGLGQPLLLSTPTVQALKGARVHHMVMKARASYVGALVRARIAEGAWADRVAVVTGMSHGVTLIDGFPQKPFGTGLPNREDDRFQWQIQGADLRLAAVFVSLSGRNQDSRKKREAAAEACGGQWFDFGPAREILGARRGPVSTSWLRFDPDFVYRKVTIKAATVNDAVELGTRYSNLLAEAGSPQPEYSHP